MRWSRYERIDAVVADWDPSTTEVFAFVRDELTRVLPAVQVEHIGSTAVPGLPGKGIVDVMVLPTTDVQTQQAADALDGLGLAPARGATPSRPFYLGAVDNGGKVTFVHAHVVRADSDEAQAQRGLAAALRTDPRLGAEYASLKRSIVTSGTTDPMEYSMKKIHWVMETLDKLGLPPLPDPGAPPSTSS